jgi:hypothetical protein
MKDDIKKGTQNLDLKMFVDRLVEEKKFPEDLEMEVIDQIKADLFDQLENRINAIIINNLSLEKREEFSKMLDKDIKDEEMQKFCNENIPDLQQLIATELIVFRQTYLS